MGGHYILKINNRCNMNCIFCADSVESRREPDMSLEAIKEGLKKNSKSFDSLIITGGEPTIYKNLLYAIKYAKTCGFKWISIATNGLLLSNKNIVERLYRAGVDSVQISYFANDDRTFKALSRTNLQNDLIDRAIRNAVEIGMTVRNNVVINNLNYKQLPEIVEKLKGFGVSHINLAFMNPVGTSVINGRSISALRFSDVMPYIRECVKISRDGMLTLENFPLCVAGEFREILSDLMKPEENQDYYNSAKHKPEECKGCIYYDECSGVWEAHLRQFGKGEIRPKYLEDMFKRYKYEISGIEAGVKKASILTVDAGAVDKYVKFLEKKSYHALPSVFSFGILDEKLRMDGNGMYSLYIAKERDAVEELKELDYYHQLKKPHPELTPREIFYRIGSLLGYPGCCSRFLWGRKTRGEYYLMYNLSDCQYEDETIYPLMALKRSDSVSHLLNNFSFGFPKLIQFFVCNYECENAAKIAEKLLDYIKINHPDEYELYKKELKRPILFFSSHRFIRFDLKEKSDKIYYNEANFDETITDRLGSEKSHNFLKIAKTFKEGNAFDIAKDKIVVYKDEKVLDTYQKKHKFDGIFIEFK